VQEVLSVQYNRTLGFLVIAFALATSGYGIYLGRFLRWNSWDLLLNPRSLAADILPHLVDPLTHPRTLGVTLLFSAFLAVAYLTMRTLSQVRWQRTL
jgi:uncharacterized membrane protein